MQVCQGGKGDDYHAGSLTSGIQVEMKTQMWLKGEKVTFPLTQIKLACTAPMVEQLRSLDSSSSGQTSGTPGFLW